MTRRSTPIWIGVIVSIYFLIGTVYTMVNYSNEPLLFYPVRSIGDFIFEHKEVAALFNHLDRTNPFAAVILGVAMLLQLILGPGALATLISLGICKLNQSIQTDSQPMS